MRLVREVDDYGDSLVSMGLAAACLRAGNLERAEFFARHCLTTCQEHGEPGNEAQAQRLLGQIAAHGPDLNLAEEYFRQALATAEGMRPARSRPTAISAWASCTAVSGAWMRPAPSCRRRSVCCARWA